MRSLSTLLASFFNTSSLCILVFGQLKSSWAKHHIVKRREQQHDTHDVLEYFDEDGLLSLRLVVIIKCLTNAIAKLFLVKVN